MRSYCWLACAVLVVACGDDDDGGGREETGNSCAAPADCFTDVEAEGDAGLRGEPLCLDRVEGGYCTHTCVTDADCCAVEGECRTDQEQVCAPFESTGMMMCFLSCEDDDLQPLPDDFEGDAGDPATAYCQAYANREFICRSTGGGAANRRVCVPGGM